MQARIQQLIIKQLKGKISHEERVELDEFTARSPENKEVVENLTDPKQLLQMIRLSGELNVDAAWQKIARPAAGRIVPMRHYIVAAVAIIIVGFVGWFFLKNNFKKEPKAEVKSQPLPFHQAILTLANGQVLDLNKLNNGSVGDDQMVTKKDGQLIYPINYHPSQPGMNILETPKGNSYSVRLSDGSTVLLNSGSSIQYPNSFTGNNRTVMVQGDVYFDVANNASKPFIVQSIADGSEIQVVGTRFTVNAYKGNNIVRITLIEGKVKVKGEGYIDSLKAGDEFIAKAGRKVQKRVVDNAEARVQGWAENKFKWVHTDLRSLLEDLSHWYGYSLDYKIDVPLTTYTITINRSEPISNVFKLLHKATDLNFKLEGTTIVVYPDKNRRK